MNQEAMKKYCKNFALDIDSISLSSQKDRNASNSNDDGFPLMIDSATSLEAADINANNFFFTSFFETTKPSKFHFSSSAQRKIKDLNEDLSDNLEFYNNKKLIVKNPTTTT
ncbi:1963_t:CDS:1, partial [Ambispora leptoticha]